MKCVFSVTDPYWSDMITESKTSQKHPKRKICTVLQGVVKNGKVCQSQW